MYWFWRARRCLASSACSFSRSASVLHTSMDPCAERQPCLKRQMCRYWSWSPMTTCQLPMSSQSGALLCSSWQ
uniref:Putative secreted protein n=1 Tax=Ixodes ricinus TaxID=34613 RepID=A0A6B0TUI4_IXORI